MADYRYPHIVQRPSKPPEEYAKIEVAYVSHLIVFVCVCAQFMFWVIVVIVCFQLMNTIAILCVFPRLHG